jgi:hypothetical protein
VTSQLRYESALIHVREGGLTYVDSVLNVVVRGVVI